MAATGIIEIYTEMTPNPESVKFITNQHILPNFQLDFKTREGSCKEIYCQWR